MLKCMCGKESKGKHQHAGHLSNCRPYLISIGKDPYKKANSFKNSEFVRN